MSAREQDLLDAIDDAQAAVALYERVLRAFLTVAALAVVVLVSGVVIGVMSASAGIDLGGYAAALIVPSAFVGPGALGAAGWWFHVQNSRPNHYSDPGLGRPWTGGPKRALVVARRAHERWVMEQAR